MSHRYIVWSRKPHSIRPHHHASLYHCLQRYYTSTSIPTPPSLAPDTPSDPFTHLSSDLSSLRSSLLTLLHSGNPALSEIAEYYFLYPSKQIRPLLVLLLSQATNGLGSQWSQKLWESTQEGERGRWEVLDRPLTRPDVLNDLNPRLARWTRQFEQGFEIKAAWLEGEKRLTRPSIPTRPYHTTRATLWPSTPTLILPTQYRLAQILEMFHTASLLHDDVIDGSPLRRGMPSAPSAFGKKVTVLGGVFLFGRAWAALAKLGDREVSELILSIMANLVDGEILQLKKIKDEEEGTGKGGGGGKNREDSWNRYIQKTYLKTASLMAKGGRAAVMLGGCKEGEIAREIAYAYGRNLGIAFQLVDDVLDYKSASEALGKPGGADLHLGLATGPALYAWEEHPEMGQLIHRRFSKDGDVVLARDYIERSSGVQRTRLLAQRYADKAKEVIQSLPDSEAKSALEVLTSRVVGRQS